MTTQSKLKVILHINHKISALDNTCIFLDPVRLISFKLCHRA
jgi:hypothetical protein